MLEVFVILYAIGIWGFLFWGPMMGGRAAYLIWKYRDTLKITTSEHVSLHALSQGLKDMMTNGNFDPERYTIYCMQVELPDNNYIEWTVSKEGQVGSNGDPTDKLQPDHVTQRRRTVAVELLRQKYAGGSTAQQFRAEMLRDERVKSWRLSWLVRWVIHKVSDEKLVLHKLSE